MRMTVDMGGPFQTMLGSSYRYYQGEFDPATGILWPDCVGQGNHVEPVKCPEGKRVGIMLVSRVALAVDLPKPAEAKPAPAAPATRKP